MPKTVDQILADAEKKHGLKRGVPAQVRGLTTGNIAIDWMTGVGGIPIGRITELYGYESSGKTTTALQTAVELQKSIKESGSDDRIAYLDYEHALDHDYAAALGVDFDHPSFIALQPDYLEQGASAALDLIGTGKVRLVVFDSVAAMGPRRLHEGEFDQATIQMHRAKLVSALCASMIGLLHEHQCAAVFVNHRMESIEMSGRPGMPPKTTTPGGRGLKYYASMRLEYNVIGGVREQLEDFVSGGDKNALVGNRVLVKNMKNKVGLPGREVEVRSRYGRGFDNAWSAVQVLLKEKLIRKDGAWYQFAQEKVPSLLPPDYKLERYHGEANLLGHADASPEWRTELIELAKRAAAGRVEAL